MSTLTSISDDYWLFSFKEFFSTSKAIGLLWWNVALPQDAMAESSRGAALGGLQDPGLDPSFWRNWLELIRFNSGSHVDPKCAKPREAVFTWLFERARENMTHSSGQRAWQLHYDILDDRIRFAVIWGRGWSSGEQEEPFDKRIPGQFWPCLVGSRVYELGDPVDSILLVFYCPALGWGGSKPWRVNITRIHMYGDLSIASLISISSPGVQPAPEAPSNLPLPQPPQPLPPPPPNLPCGWDYAFNSEGRIYYYHKELRVSSWSQPFASESHATSGMHPNGSTECISPGGVTGEHTQTEVDPLEGSLDGALEVVTYPSTECIEESEEPEGEPQWPRMPSMSSSSATTSSVSDTQIAMVASIVDMDPDKCQKAIRTENGDLAKAVEALLALQYEYVVPSDDKDCELPEAGTFRPVSLASVRSLSMVSGTLSSSLDGPP